MRRSTKKNPELMTQFELDQLLFGTIVEAGIRRADAEEVEIKYYDMLKSQSSYKRGNKMMERYFSSRS